MMVASLSAAAAIYWAAVPWTFPPSPPHFCPPPSPTQFVMMVASLSAAAAIYWASVPWTFPLTVALGGLATYIWNWSKDMALHVG